MDEQLGKKFVHVPSAYDKQQQQQQHHHHHHHEALPPSQQRNNTNWLFVPSSNVALSASPPRNHGLLHPSNNTNNNNNTAPDRLSSIGFNTTAEKPLSYRWDDMYQRLKRFYETHGHCRVPSNYDDGEKGPFLGYWVRRQLTDIPPRVASGKRFAIERKQRLDAIGFEWDKVFDAKWREMFEELKRFKEQHGHCRVPLSSYDDSSSVSSGSSASTASKTNLGRWCHEQRKNIPAKLGGNDPVYEERKQQLDSIGFEWELESEKERRWRAMFGRLMEFKKNHGHTRVPKSHKDDSDGANLAFWVRNQQEKVPRKAAEGAQLYIERKKKLDSIGFEWTRVHTEQWATMFKKLEEYKKKHGNTRVPYRTPNEEEDSESSLLGIWVYAQRTKLPSKVKQGDPISIERKQKLDGIGFEWDSPLSNKWDVMFSGLKRFKQKFGHTRVPRTYKDEEEPLPANLGSWVITQRRTIAAKAESGDEMSIARKLCLDSLGFRWGGPNTPKKTK